MRRQIYKYFKTQLVDLKENLIHLPKKSIKRSILPVFAKKGGSFTKGNAEYITAV